MFKPKISKQEQGFTLVEVLVAILIAIIFVTIAMQMMVMAAFFKVRAQEYAEATSWIQEDLENLKYQAANYQYTILKVAANSTDIVLQVSSVDNFQAGDTLIIGNDSTNNTIQSINSSATPPTITLTAALDSNWSIDIPVVATTRCNPGAPTDPRFDSGLLAQLPTSPISKASKLFTNKTYSLTRTITSDSPYRVLKVSYDVLPSSGGESVASFYTEVIPNAALQCPN
jgi:prepilin-type N-terminal cleavage/methylation domain-containing protein